MIIVNTQIDPPYIINIKSTQLVTIVKSTLKVCNITNAELTIVITSDDFVRDLNRQYRGLDAYTDVLSFANNNQDDLFITTDEVTSYFGDIIISAPTAIKQALLNNHIPTEEILLLTIHGVLHLLGFNHITPLEKKEMWQKQTEILHLNNLSHVKPTEETY